MVKVEKIMTEDGRLVRHTIYYDYERHGWEIKYNEHCYPRTSISTGMACPTESVWVTGTSTDTGKSLTSSTTISISKLVPPCGFITAMAQP